MRYLTKAGIAIVSVVVLSSCMNLFGGGDSSDDDSRPAEGNPSDTLQFDLSNAAAVGAAEMNVSANNLTGSSLMEGSSSSESAFGLVKVLDDGSIEMAMDAPEDVWLPDVQFIAIAPEDDNDAIYTSFDGEINLGWDDEADEEIRIGGFLHIEPDGTYYEIMDGEGRVKDYSWSGNDEFKPVAFDDAGNVYFVWESWSGGDTIEVLYQYDPNEQSTTALTAQLSGYHYESFRVSPDGSRLFVRGTRDSQSGGSEASFFRMYPTSDMENPKTIYYSSSSDVWVRGYIVSPDGDEVLMNGNNIRGNNGIMRAEIVSNTEIDYDPIFDASDDWFDPQYHEWYSEWEDRTYYDGFFDRISEWGSYALMTDGTNFQYLRFSDAVDDHYNSVVATKDMLGGDTSYDFEYRDLSFATDLDDATQGEPVEDVIDNDAKDTTNPVYDNFDPDGDFAADDIIFGYEESEWVDGHSEYSFELIENSVAIELAKDDGPSELYTWNDHWSDESDTDSLDVERIRRYLDGFFATDFQFEYEGSVGNAAWDAFFADEPYEKPALYGSPERNDHILETYFGQAQTIRDFKEQEDLQWLDFGNIGSLFYDRDGYLWGVAGGNWGSSNGLRPIRLLDADGKKSLRTVSSLSTDEYQPVGFAVEGNELYFRDAVLDSDGFEIGYHRMYRVDLDNPDAPPEDVLTGLGDANGQIEIVDFSIGNGFLYFTAVDGIELIGGKIDTQTMEYTEFDSDYVIQNIEVY